MCSYPCVYVRMCASMCSYPCVCVFRRGRVQHRAGGGEERGQSTGPGGPRDAEGPRDGGQVGLAVPALPQPQLPGQDLPGAHHGQGRPRRQSALFPSLYLTHLTASHCTSLYLTHLTASYCTSLHWVSYTSLHLTALHISHTSLHLTAHLTHFTASHCTSLHCPSLHFTTANCT